MHQFVDSEGYTYRISSRTTASVEASGAIAVTRGRNLAAKAAGAAAGALVIPGGIFLFGNARHKMYDLRELLFVVEDPQWHYAVACHPDAAVEVQGVASAVRRAATLMRDYEEKVAALTRTRANSSERRTEDGSDPQRAATAAPDLVSQLVTLADLRERGALTESEFEEAKAKILRSP